MALLLSLCPPPPWRNSGIARSVRLSVPWRSRLGYRHAGCLQQSHRWPPEMCGLRTRPRTDVDPSAGGISSRRPFGDTFLLPKVTNLTYVQGHGDSQIKLDPQLLLLPFNGLFSRTTWVSRYQKGKNNLDFSGARDSEWQWHQLGHMQVCTSLQTDNHTSTPPLCFLQAGCPSCRPTNSVNALKAQVSEKN